MLMISSYAAFYSISCLFTYLIHSSKTYFGVADMATNAREAVVRIQRHHGTCRRVELFRQHGSCPRVDVVIIFNTSITLAGTGAFLSTNNYQ